MIFDYLNKTFNNREIALIFYLIVFIIWALTQPKIKESIITLVKVFLGWKIQVSVFHLLLYVSLIIYGLRDIGFWSFSMIKDTIYWTFGVGFILMMNSDKALKEEYYFKKIIKDNFKFLIIIEFVVGLYVFGIITELILMPVVIFLSMLLGYSEIYKEHKQVNNFLQTVFSIGGIGYLIFSIYHIYQDFNDFATYNTLKAFLFPIALTFLFIPFAYFYALFMHYESLFVRVGFSFKDDKVLLRYAKWRILVSVNFSLPRLKKIAPGFLFGGCKTKEDIKNEIKYKLNPAANK